MAYTALEYGYDPRNYVPDYSFIAKTGALFGQAMEGIAKIKADKELVTDIYETGLTLAEDKAKEAGIDPELAKKKYISTYKYDPKKDPDTLLKTWVYADKAFEDWYNKQAADVAKSLTQKRALELETRGQKAIGGYTELGSDEEGPPEQIQTPGVKNRQEYMGSPVWEGMEPPVSTEEIKGTRQFGALQEAEKPQTEYQKRQEKLEKDKFELEQDKFDALERERERQRKDRQSALIANKPQRARELEWADGFVEAKGKEYTKYMDQDAKNINPEKVLKLQTNIEKASLIPEMLEEAYRQGIEMTYDEARAIAMDVNPENKAEKTLAKHAVEAYKKVGWFSKIFGGGKEVEEKFKMTEKEAKEKLEEPNRYPTAEELVNKRSSIGASEDTSPYSGEKTLTQRTEEILRESNKNGNDIVTYKGEKITRREAIKRSLTEKMNNPVR